MTRNETAQSPFIDFDSVYREELQEVISRRTAFVQTSNSDDATTERLAQLAATAGNRQAPLSAVQHAVLQADLCGLAISGGGIRSATFALGVLQGLAATRMLPRFDYLSTVSGGGYIGSWLMSWIREQGLTKVQEGLQPPRLRVHTSQEPDPPEVRHIRRYSNYLAPRPGLFTVDGWTLVAIFARNMLLNQAVLFFAAIGVLFFLRFLMEWFSLVYSLTEVSPDSPHSLVVHAIEWVVTGLALFWLILSLLGNFQFVHWHRLKNGNASLESSEQSSWLIRVAIILTKLQCELATRTRRICLT